MVRIATVREFRDKATRMLRGKDPVLVLRRGKVAGIFFPYPTDTLPLEFRRELFSLLSASIAERLKQAGVEEGEILEDFEEHRKARRRR